MRGAAMAIGAEVEIETTPGCRTMHNNQALYDLYLDEASEVYGEKVHGSIYRDPGSTDMGDVSAIMPAIHPFAPGTVGTGHTASLHVPDLRGTCT